MMIMIARGAARGRFGAWPPERPVPPRCRRAPARRHAARGGRSAPRAPRSDRSGHHAAGDGEATRSGGGRGGEAGPAAKIQSRLGQCSSPRSTESLPAVGGTAGRSPPQWGAGEGGGRRDERGGGEVAGARAGEGEEEQRAGEKREEAGDGEVYVDGPDTNGNNS
jgi:hypothetical protein